MSLPTSIRVGPHDVKVFYRADLQSDDDTVLLGTYEAATRKIFIRQGMSPTMMAHHLMHELLHAAWAETQFCTEDQEERACTVLSSMLTQIARDNPEFIRQWLNLSQQ